MIDLIAIVQLARYIQTLIIESGMEIINKHRPFKATGDDFSTSNPMFAYYFYKYYLSQIKPIYDETKDASQKAQLQVQIKQTFNLMNKNSQQCALDPSDEVNMKAILQYTELMFAKTDHFHQQGKFTKQIAEDYLTIYRLYQIVNRFGKLDEGQSKRRVYSKKKFIDIMKQLKKNPALENANPNVVKQSIKPAVEMPPPVFKEEVKIQKIQQSIKKSQFKPLPKPSKLISFDKIQMSIQATKNLQNALSELSFDRYKHARDQVLNALNLLDQMIDS